MRIALYAKEFKQAEYAEEIIRRWDGWRIQMDMDYFQSPEKLLKILEEQSYDMIIFVSNGELKEEEHIRSIRKKERHTVCNVVYGKHYYGPDGEDARYAARFNGCDFYFNIKDIYYLESYNRKTSVVTRKESIRISANLDEEEKKLLKAPFVRINQSELINMMQISFVEHKRVIMRNGAELFISSNRRREFIEKYRWYIEEYSSVL